MELEGKVAIVTGAGKGIGQGIVHCLAKEGADVVVNSLHAQAIDRPAERIAVEAVAPDGTIEAVHVRDARAFALGIQWHPEWRWHENRASRAIFAAFGDACRERARGREGADARRDVA